MMGKYDVWHARPMLQGRSKLGRQPMATPLSRRLGHHILTTETMIQSGLIQQKQKKIE